MELSRAVDVSPAADRTILVRQPATLSLVLSQHGASDYGDRFREVELILVALKMASSTLSRPADRTEHRVSSC